MYYVYILYSESFDKYYVGYTNDHVLRLHAHNTTNRNTYTSKYRPWAMAAVFEVGPVESEAVRIERFIKKQKSRKLIEAVISGRELQGILAQLVRVPHVRD
jgi:putative endonuclease